MEVGCAADAVATTSAASADDTSAKRTGNSAFEDDDVDTSGPRPGICIHQDSCGGYNTAGVEIVCGSFKLGAVLASIALAASLSADLI